MRTWTKKYRLVVALLAVGTLAAACSSDSKTSTSSSGSKSLVSVPGFDGTTIKVGVVTPQTGTVKIIGDPLTAGNKAYWDYINSKGGIAGKYKIEPVVVDSAYDATQGVQQYNAIKDQVVMFGQILGTPVVKAVLEQLKADNIVGAPATLDSFWVREQNLLPIGAPYQIQAINGIDWYTSDGGGKDKKLCSLVADDPYGSAGQAGVDFAVKELGLTLTDSAKFTASTASAALDPTAKISQLQGSGCEAIWLTSTPTDTGKILGAAAAAKWNPQWLGQSPSYIGALTTSPLAPYLQANYLVVSEGVTWGDTSVPGMKDLLDRVAQFAPSQAPDYYFVFGYNEGRSVADLLEKAVALGDLSHDGIVNAMNSIDKLSFDGLSGDYGYGKPSDRNPPRVNSVFEVDPAAPGGLKVKKANIASDAAKKFTFG
ncbi:MAG: ABC transporter substrate-binding protein [Acidimicrobiales bacterium]